jgi:endo-1,4-beta-xylanase
MAIRLRKLVLLSMWVGVVAGGCAPDQTSAPSASGISIAFVGTGSASIQNDFEDGTTQGWFPFGSPTVANSTDMAFSGTHSLKITNRTATYMGPGVSLTGQLQAGASYKVSLAARLLAGQSPTTLQVTMQRSMSDGTQAYDTVVASTNVTADGWATLSGNYSFTANNVTGLILYVQSASATASFYIDAFSLALGAPAPISYDFEDGTTNPFFAFGPATLANSTAAAFTGTHSLAITGRGASYAGPGVNLQGQLTKGATYQVTMSVRMVTGQPTSTLQATMQRTPTGGSATYDSVATASNVTDQAWVTMSAVYSFSTDNSGLILYVQSSSGTGSFYLDAVSITQLAPPAGPPGNTTGATSTFESNTAEGWTPHYGIGSVTPTTADAHGGTYSLLTTGRSGTYAGPSYDVTNVMFNGSRYNVSLWVKMAPGAENEQLRISLDRHLGSTETFHQVVGNTTVTSGAWVRLQATYDMALANTQVILYVESNAGTSSFYIDDFSITYVPPAIAETNIPSVFQTWSDYFPVGAAVVPSDIQGQSAVLLAKHFNSMTSGNDMKWDATEPSEGNFTFTQADAEVAFATANNMRVRGHTLVWYQQTPAWVFNDASGNLLTPSDATRALLIQRMQNHITNVMQHFGTAVATWDVVNEPIDETQSDGLRRNNWYNLIGPDYIAIALNAARAASPTAKLYINDYNTTIPAKQAALLTLVNNLKAAGAPLDGIGHQMHSNVEFPSPQSLIDTVNAFNAAGVENSITEMDVSIYSGSYPTPFTSYTDIPQSRHVMVGYSYMGFFQALKSLKGKVASVTIWGTSDDKTWLNTSTQIDAPLLFDPSLTHKPAYWGVVDPLQLPGADLSAAISAAPTTVPAGQAIAYTITVANNADVNQASYDPTDDDLPATNVVLATAIPAHTVLQALSVPSGWSCAAPPAGASGPVQCTMPSLAVGATATFTMTVSLADCATANASTIVASASVSSSTADPNPAPNNAASASVQVTNTPPVITANGSLTATVECATSYVDPGATATDSCEGPVPVATTSNVNSAQVGSYSVTYNAADKAGDQATPVVRTVNVADTTPPVVMDLGANPMTVECGTGFTDPGATGTDSCAGPLPVVTTGSINAGTPGSSTLVYSATDPSGNLGLTTRVVNVTDTTAPAINPVDLTILAPLVTIVVENGVITVNGQRLPLRWSGSVPVDGHIVSISGGVITVDGHTPSFGGQTIVLLPPNHNYHTFTMADLIASVTDTCDTTTGLASALISQVTSDEAVNSKGSGNTNNDIVIGADCRSVQLRVERDGGGNGRVYTIALHAQDASGNRTATTVQVMVPKDLLTPVVDDGAHYTVVSSCP